MGITNFKRFINAVKSKFATVVQYAAPDDVTSLLIDANAVVYKALAHLRKENPTVNNLDYITLSEMVIDKSIEMLEEYRKEHNPTELFAILLDGVAPDAKVIQQMLRRLLAALAKSEALRSRNRTEEQENLVSSFDTAIISPGTNFMARFSAELKKYMSSLNVVEHTKHLVFSSDMVPGEGEHKIFDLFRRRFVKRKGNHVIVSDDSDIVVLAAAQTIPNIYIKRHDNWIDINIIKYYITEVWGASVDDFLLMIAFMGNDFIPAPISFMSSTIRDYNVVDILMEVYKETMMQITQKQKNLVINGKPNTRNLLVFIHNLRLRELEMLKKVAPNRTSQMFKDTFTYFSRNYKEGESGYEYINDNSYDEFVTKWRDLEYDLNETVPKKNITPEDMALDAGLEYLYGIIWTYNYYTTGRADWLWSYRYSLAPMLVDIDALSAYDDEPEFRSDVDKRIERLDTSPAPLMTIPQVLVSIIPPNVPDGSIPEELLSIVRSRPEKQITIEYFGLDPTSTHVVATNIVRAYRIKSKTGEYTLNLLNDEQNKRVLAISGEAKYRPGETLVAEKKESAINLALKEKSEFEEKMKKPVTKRTASTTPTATIEPTRTVKVNRPTIVQPTATSSVEVPAGAAKKGPAPRRVRR